MSKTVTQTLLSKYYDSTRDFLFQEFFDYFVIFLKIILFFCQLCVKMVSIEIYFLENDLRGAMPFMEENNKVIEENKKTKSSEKKRSVPKKKNDTEKPELTEAVENEALSLDSLALEPDTVEDSHESAEEIADYASFLASYNALMADRLAMARSKGHGDESASPDNEDSSPEEDGDTVEPPSEILPIEQPIKESDEVEVIVKQDIEFHKEIVSGKGERVNAEDYIVLVPKKDDEPTEELTDNTDETEEPIAEEAELEAEPHSDSYEEYEKEAKISPEELEYDHNQISMMLGDEPKEQKRDPSRYDEKHPRIIDHVFDVIEMLVLTLAAAIVVTSIFFRFSFVDGHSMDRTLNDGDTLIISNLFYTPDYLDIVVIEYEDNLHNVQPLIKRVIGLPGDTIEINRYGDVYRNGVLLDETAYVYNDGCSSHLVEGKWLIGEDEIFVMGDHRDDSKDSRDIGPVKINSIIGHAIFRLFPLKDIGTLK